MNNNYDLKSMCFNSSNYRNDNFVGISFANNEKKVFFPIGYRIPENNDECRISILNLMKLISLAKKKVFDKRFGINSGNEYELPINSYLWIIADYLNNGLYFDIEKKYEKNQNGKINWKKTLNSKFYVSNNSIIYLNPYVERKTTEKSIITDIHVYCVEKGIKEIGWLFGNIGYPKSNLDENKLSYYIKIINKELMKTFDDKKKRLLVHMKRILECSSDEKNSIIEKEYGTYNFEYIWEYIIDGVFGNEDAHEFFPDASMFVLNWGEKKTTYLRPDTILSFNNNIYILDSKYYRFGIIANEKHLPQTDSIQKQITYGEYVFNKKKYKEVYNAFIMPYNKNDNKFNRHNNIENVGYAKSNWKEQEKHSFRTYEHISLILVDTKYIIDCFLKKEDSDTLKLINSIQKNIRTF